MNCQHRAPRIAEANPIAVWKVFLDEVLRIKRCQEVWRHIALLQVRYIHNVKTFASQRLYGTLKLTSLRYGSDSWPFRFSHFRVFLGADCADAPQA